MSSGRRKCIAMRATMKNTVPMIPTSARRAAHLVADAPGTDCELPPRYTAAIVEPPCTFDPAPLCQFGLRSLCGTIDCTTVRASSHEGILLTLPLFPESSA